MKKPFFIVSLLLALLFAIATPASTNANVLAQDPNACYDAAGAVIPCPPTPGGGGGSGGSGGEEEEEDNTPGGGNQNPPVVPTATATPLPIALPESDYLGSCNSSTGNLQDCLDQFTCEDGTLVIKVDIYTGGNGTQYDVYCIPHETLPTLDLPFSIPDEGSTDDTNWTGGCFGDNVDECIENLAALCDADGGDLSVWYDDEGGAGAYCENSTPADSQPAPTEEPSDIAAAPTDDGSTEGNEDWEEGCNWGTCWMTEFSCWLSGGDATTFEDGQGGFYTSCDMPEDEGQSFPPGGWAPWILGTIVILIGLLLPAVQKVREAAARTRAESHAAKIDLINKDDGGTEASDYLLEIDGIKGKTQHIKKATLFVRKSGGSQEDY